MPALSLARAGPTPSPNLSREKLLCRVLMGSVRIRPGEVCDDQRAGLSVPRNRYGGAKSMPGSRPERFESGRSVPRYGWLRQREGVDGE
jgi:hypothetical protein